jgi:signal transduction histidine kinase
LSLVRRVFEAHGGGIVCEASPLGGARFRGTLPLREPSRAT